MKLRINQLHFRIKELRAENAELRKVLAWYASEDNYEYTHTENMGERAGWMPVDDAMGALARKVLKAQRQGGK